MERATSAPSSIGAKCVTPGSTSSRPSPTASATSGATIGGSSLPVATAAPAATTTGQAIDGELREVELLVRLVDARLRLARTRQLHRAVGLRGAAHFDVGPDRIRLTSGERWFRTETIDRFLHRAEDEPTPPRRLDQVRRRRRERPRCRGRAPARTPSTPAACRGAAARRAAASPRRASGRRRAQVRHRWRPRQPASRRRASGARPGSARGSAATRRGRGSRARSSGTSARRWGTTVAHIPALSPLPWVRSNGGPSPPRSWRAACSPSSSRSCRTSMAGPDPTLPTAVSRCRRVLRSIGTLALPRRGTQRCRRSSSNCCSRRSWTPMPPRPRSPGCSTRASSWCRPS